MNFNQLLKSKGLKITSKRIAILEILNSAKNPVDIEYIKESMKNRHLKIDDVTIYRIIDNFLAARLVHKYDFLEGKFRYEFALRNHHHHAVCQKCGTIEDIHNDYLEKTITSLSTRNKFTALDHTFELYGLCYKCTPRHAFK